jgi:hypothetical protein
MSCRPPFRRIPCLSSAQREAIRAKTVCNGPDDCWFYDNFTVPNRYPQIELRGEKYNLSRVIMDAPTDLCVLHSCDNPNCVNPAHLRLGTQLENVMDFISKRKYKRNPDDELKRSKRIEKMKRKLGLV